MLGSIGGETEDLQAGCRNCDDAERGDKASDAEVHAPAEGPSAQCDGEGVKAQECVRPRVESAQKESLRRGTLVQTYDEFDWEQAYVPKSIAPVSTREAALGAPCEPAKGAGAVPPPTRVEASSEMVERLKTMRPIEPMARYMEPRVQEVVLRPRAVGCPQPYQLFGTVLPLGARPPWSGANGASGAPSRSSSVPNARSEKTRAPAWVPVGQLPRPVQEWQEAEVCRWLLEVFQAPQDLVSLVREQAITGKVLLSLSERDLQELPVPKFGHRRLLMLAAQELRHRAVTPVVPPVVTPVVRQALAPGSCNGSGPRLAVGQMAPQVPMRSTLPSRVRVLATPPYTSVPCGATVVPPRIPGGTNLATQCGKVTSQSVVAPVSPHQARLPVSSPRDTVDEGSLLAAARSRSLSPRQSRLGAVARPAPHRFAWEPLAREAQTSLTHL